MYARLGAFVSGSRICYTRMQSSTMLSPTDIPPGEHWHPCRTVPLAGVERKLRTSNARARLLARRGFLIPPPPHAPARISSDLSFLHNCAQLRRTARVGGDFYPLTCLYLRIVRVRSRVRVSARCTGRWSSLSRSVRTRK